jgi:hypothetical protein
VLRRRNRKSVGETLKCNAYRSARCTIRSEIPLVIRQKDFSEFHRCSGAVPRAVEKRTEPSEDRRKPAVLSRGVVAWPVDVAMA